MDVAIEPERPSDHAAIRALVREAFSHHESVADLVDLIRASPEFVPSLALVARHRDEVVGFVLLSHAEVVDDLDCRRRVLTLSPLAVLPAMHGRGVGSGLVPAGLAAAEGLGEPLVVLEGSPAYYPRFGFEDARQLGIRFSLPEWAPPEAGMVFRLSAYDPSIRGRVVYPPAFAATGS